MSPDIPLLKSVAELLIALAVRNQHVNSEEGLGKNNPLAS